MSIKSIIHRIKKRCNQKTRLGAYAAAKYLTLASEKDLGVLSHFDVYQQHLQVAITYSELAFTEDLVKWDPDIRDGPTSARYAIVNYDGDTQHLTPKAVWSEKDVFSDTESKEENRNSLDVF